MNSGSVLPFLLNQEWNRVSCEDLFWVLEIIALNFGFVRQRGKKIQILENEGSSKSKRSWNNRAMIEGFRGFNFNLINLVLFREVFKSRNRGGRSICVALPNTHRKTLYRFVNKLSAGSCYPVYNKPCFRV